MLRLDETAVICDFAETYHLTDYRALPATRAAALAVGLRENSRIKMRLTGVRLSTDTALLAAMTDRLSLLLWAKTQDAANGRNRPASILDALLHPEGKPADTRAFASGEDFLRYWRSVTTGGDRNANRTG